jgi:uncharacterized protein YdeI (YjbR/CyaY-like superfamily)
MKKHDKDAKAKVDFGRLTLGKKREYADHVASAKQAVTKQRRVARVVSLLARGGGLNDKVR